MIARVLLALVLGLTTARCLGAGPAATTAPSSAIATLRENFVRSVIPDTPGQLRGIQYLARRFAKELRPDGTWAGIDYRDQSPVRWAAAAHLERVLLMCKEYRILRDRGAADADLKRQIDLALNHWLDRDYQNPGWWWNQISVPRLVGESLILLSPDASPTQLEKGKEILERARWEKWTGQNLIRGVTIQIMRGILADDPVVISAGYQRMYQEIRISEGDGIQRDYSFHQHGEQLCSGGYGLDFANDVGRFMAFAWGTPWQAPPDKLELFSRYVLDGEAWMIWERTFDYSAVGREIVRKGFSPLPRSWANGPVAPVGAAYSLLNMVSLLDQHPLPRLYEWQALESRLGQEPRAPALFGNKYFWCSDYMTHRRLTWFASVKMLSDRMINAELVNGEGEKSQHLSEGATFIYRTGDEYRDIFPVWDWRKIPGTTAEQFPLTPDQKEIQFKGASGFVGGVSDGAYGLACMELNRRTLRAHKAWFFFDDEFVCLGAGINCASDEPVVTTVNQCLFRGQVNQGFNPAHRWVHHDGIGYIFPRYPDPEDRNPLSPAPRVVVIARAQSGSWADIGPGPDERVTKRVFTIGIDHGRHPMNATYAYIVLPDVPADEVARRSERLDIDILANGPDLQAVYHRGLDTLMAAFYKPGKLGNLSVDQPCLVLFRAGRVTLANPLNKPLTVKVAFGAIERTVELPSGPTAGSSVTIDTNRP